MTLKEQLAFLRDTELGTIVDGLSLLKLKGALPSLRAVTPGVKFAAPAGTAAVTSGPAEKTYSGYKAMSLCAPGEALVVAGCSGATMLGDNMARFAQNCGLAALVWQGTCRDMAGIAETGLPVYAEGLNIAPAAGMKIFSIGEPIEIDGVSIKPGDIIVGDAEGVLAIPAERVEELIYQVEKVIDVEARMSEALDRKAGLEEVSSIIKQKKVPRE